MRHQLVGLAARRGAFGGGLLTTTTTTTNAATLFSPPAAAAAPRILRCGGFGSTKRSVPNKKCFFVRRRHTTTTNNTTGVVHETLVGRAMGHALEQEELFAFDLNGFIVVKNVFTEEEIEAMNAAVDAHEHEMVERKGQLRLGGKKGRTAGRRRRHGATRSGRHARLAWRGEDAVPKNARASKTGAVLHRLVRRRVQNGPLTAVDSTEERRGRLRFSRREIEPRRELDTRFSVRVREWKAVLSLVSREHRVDDDENWRRVRRSCPGRIRATCRHHRTDEDVEANGERRNPEIERGDVLLFTEACTHGTIP